MRNPLTLLLLLAAYLPIYSTSNIGSYYGTKYLSQVIESGISFSGKKISLKGEFVIDVSYNFYGVEIDMDPNAITLVKPNVQAAFYDSHIFCSKGMWSGISTYGQITVSESFIEDATVGVYVLPGGQANIRKTDFKNNVIGAQCTGNGFISVDQCNFLADINGLHIPYPAIYNTSYRGIYIENCSGSFNVLSNNYFSTVQNGIVIENSSTYSDVNDNNVYENIYPNSEYADYKFGNAIQLINASFTQKGAASGKKYSNRGAQNYDYNFINCKVGIYCENSYVNVSENDFHTCLYGIQVTKSSSTNELLIKSNKIVECSIGIYLTENTPPVGPKGKILYNVITMPTKVAGARGIYYQNSTNIASTLLIFNNVINIQSDNCAGIFLSRVSFVSIYKNNISVLGTFPSYVCIDLLNSTGVSVSTNNVKASSILYKIKQDANKVGIRIRDSEQSNIGCNIIESCPVDLQVLGECDLSTIHGNTFKNSAVGLMIGNGDQLDGICGIQTGMKNEWVGIFTKYKAWFSVNTGNPYNIIGSYFFVDFSVPIYNPTTQYKSEVPGDPWFYDSVDYAKPGCDVFVSKDDINKKEKDYTTLKIILDMITKSIITSGASTRVGISK